MKKLAAVLLVALAAWMLSLPETSAAAEAARMVKDDLKLRIGNPETVVIDVRAFTDWLLTPDKIKSAVRENPKEFDQWHGKYAKDKTIVLYCA